MNPYPNDEHARCNGLLRRIGQSVAAARWPDARREVTALQQWLERHLSIEERIGFIEAGLGQAGAQAGVVRAEHSHIRRLAQGLADAVTARNPQGLAAQAEALLLAMHLQGAPAAL